MGQEVDYVAVAADLEARIATLQAALAAVKAILGRPGEGSSGGVMAPITLAARGEVTDVVPGVFHGMSVSEAAKAFLEMKKSKQKTRSICDAMLAGGIESDARDFYSNVYTTLARNKDFFRRGKYWMLTSWDPRRAAAAAIKPVKKTRRSKKGRKAAKTDKNNVVDISSGGEKAETA